MRIQIPADVGKGLTLPINYNYQLASTIYRFLAAGNGCPKIALNLFEKERLKQIADFNQIQYGIETCFTT